MTDTIQTSELLAAIPGLTFRQLDHWIVSGYLGDIGGQPGSGYNRAFTLGEVEQVRTMHRLVEAGLTVPRAAQIASEHIRGRGKVELGPGVRLVMTRGKP